MSQFKELTEKIIAEQKDQIKKRSYSEILNVFGLSLLTEDIDKAALILAQDMYNRFANAIKEKDYIEENNYTRLIQLDEVDISISVLGQYYGKYDIRTNTIYSHTEHFNTILKDKTLRTILIHEFTHFLAISVDNNLNDYIKPEINYQGYITQDSEIEANVIALSDLLSNKIKKVLQKTITQNDLDNKEALHKYLDKLIHDITAKDSFFGLILNQLKKDPEKFMEFYEHTIDTCLVYLDKNKKECTFWALDNSALALFKREELKEDAKSDSLLIRQAKQVLGMFTRKLKHEYSIIPFDAEAINTTVIVNSNPITLYIDFKKNSDISGYFDHNDNSITLYLSSSLRGLAYLEKHLYTDMQIRDILSILHGNELTNTFIHEYQHYIYSLKNKNIKYTAYDVNNSDNNDYYTNADEYNAFSLEGLHSSLQLAKKVFKKRKLYPKEFNMLFKKYKKDLLKADWNNYYTTINNIDFQKKYETKLYEYLYYMFVEGGLEK